MKSTSDQLFIMNRLVFMLSLVGIVMAVYVLQSFLRDAPILCINTGCELVRKHPASYIGPIPVPAFGLIGYSCMVFFTFLNTLRKKPLYNNILFAIALFGVLFVLWFTWTEITVIKAFCTWCILSAINMCIIFLLLFYSLWLSRNAK